MHTFSNRRNFFKKLSLLLASFPLSYPGIAAIFSSPEKRSGIIPDHKFKGDFDQVNDRTWLGQDYWAIPMEDWRVKDHKVEFIGEHRNSRVNILTTQIARGKGQFLVEVDFGVLDPNLRKNGSAGFSVGISDDLDTDVKAACYYGKGMSMGVSTKGYLFIENDKKELPEQFDYSSCKLSLKAEYNGKASSFSLSCSDKHGRRAQLIHESSHDISGLIALVNNVEEKNGCQFWFSNLTIKGSKLTYRPEDGFGPILWSMYTLSKGTLNLSAQMPPLGQADSQSLELWLKKDKKWERAAVSKIDEGACTAHFNIEGWDASLEVPYQLRYRNHGAVYKYDGKISKEPLGRPLVFGGLTCQHDNAYPYTPLVKNLKKYNPDILFFSGDQLYEANGGYPIKRQPESGAILNYLGKWYMFGWAFGDLMRDRPTICTPDDHDVFQGNLWGEGGERISLAEWKKIKSDHGGYVQTPGMVNVVHKTQCGHLPAPFHPEVLESGITTWHTDLLYGNISFAIISDRMFKSGPELVRDKASGERRDLITAPVDKADLEDPNLEFLGDRQMEFLEKWVNDWSGAEMKVLLSQTLFSNVATHYGPRKMRVLGDLDSGGWPKKKKDAALRLVRKAFAFHINGDQHLPFLVQYSLDQDRDAGWTFCTPAISTGYPRWAQPDNSDVPYSDRPAHNLPNTGLYEDIFGNKNYVYAVGNPENHPKGDRYTIAQQKASGFGIITFNTEDRSIKMEALRFLADKDNPGQTDSFPGWPLTIRQWDNDGREASGFLPRLQISLPDQVVKIIREEDNEVINVIRIKGSVYQPKVFADGSYRIEVGEGNEVRTFRGILSEKSEGRMINVNF